MEWGHISNSQIVIPNTQLFRNSMPKVIVLALLVLSASASLSKFCVQLADRPPEPDPTAFQASIFECVTRLIDDNQKEDIRAIELLLSATEEKLVAEVLEGEIKKLYAIEEYIVTNSATCEPIIQWAQNNTHIFIVAKLSHRWDSPPCLKTVTENYQLTNSTLLFDNTCVVSSSKINFLLNRTLLKPALNGVTVKKDGVGTYSLVIAKADEGVWPALFLSGDRTPVWEELMQRDTVMQQKFLEARKIFQQQLFKNEKLVYFGLFIVFLAMVLI